MTEALPGTFEVQHTDSKSGARVGRLQTAHGPVSTPVFMPVGTQGSVKAMSPAEMLELDTEILLGNVYHLNVRPGMEVIEACGGLHSFMGWDRPILTDSGGFQVFSLAQLRKIRPDGVEFQSHVDGATIFLGPREAMSIQRTLGSDIAMAFDECPSHDSTPEYTCQAVERTLTWAALCLEQLRAPGQLVFGIVQGGEHAELRQRCSRELVAMEFDGYAIGGVSVGEPEKVLLQGVRDSVPHLPEDRPRYLMGVGKMHQIIEAVAQGVDMFDCVMPTRFARNGSAFTRKGRVPIKASEFRMSTEPIEKGCTCYACSNFSRAYVRHLLNVKEILGVRLLTMHNLHRYSEFMKEIRTAISEGNFSEYRTEFLREFADSWSNREGDGQDE